jgi:hypothetical protein
MADQSGIAIEGRSVVAAGGRRQADAVEVLQVGRAEGADFDHLRLSRAPVAGNRLRSIDPVLPAPSPRCIPSSTQNREGFKRCRDTSFQQKDL